MQKGTDLHASVLLSLAANTPLLSGTSHVVFLLRSDNTGDPASASLIWLKTLRAIRVRVSQQSPAKTSER